METSRDNIPKITVVVPVYNVEKYLEKCVDSLCAQTFRDLEILLIDDGSTDGSGAMCDRLAAERDRIRVLHKENGGLSDARNYGVRHAAGDYVGFVDSDDYVDADMYEFLYENLVRERADVSVCTSYSCYQDRIVPMRSEGSDVMTGPAFIGLSLEDRKCRMSACVKIYRKDLLLETPFTVGALYEDALLLGPLFSRVKNVVIAYEPKYYYVHHAGTITTKPYSSRRSRDHIRAFRNDLDIVRQVCPQYEKAGQYRLLRAYYEELDDAVLSDTPDARADIPMLRRYLRKHSLQLLSNPYITSARKAATLTALVSLGAYRRLLLRKNNRNNLVD